MQVSITEAANNLPDLVMAALNGEEVILLEDNQPTIKLIPIKPVKPRLQFGSAKGLIWISDDFDEPLEELKEYME